MYAGCNNVKWHTAPNKHDLYDFNTSFISQQQGGRGPQRIFAKPPPPPPPQNPSAHMLSSSPLLPISLTSPVPLSPHNPSGPRRFQDSYGRERHFQGTNVVVKGTPWLPDTGDYSTDISLNEQDFLDMRAMGLNQLR